MKTLSLRLLPLLALCLIAAGKKEPQTTVRFYPEANPQDTSTFAVPVTLQYPPRNAYISKIPAVSERDVTAIYPFQAADGTIGCVFLLTEHGKLELDSLTVEKRGTSLVALVNGRQVIDMTIDKRIPDGILVIPKGMTVEEGVALKKAFKVVNGPPPKS